MTIAVCMAWWLGFQAPPDLRPVRHAEPLANRATLTVMSDRSNYYVHESVVLTVTVRNEGREPLRAHLWLGAGFRSLEVWYRIDGAPYARWTPRRYAHGGPRKPKILDPEGEHSARVLLVVDAATQRFVLDQPGRYEIRVVYRDVENDPKAVLESREIAFQVAAPPAALEQAFSRFTLDIGGVAQLAGGGSGSTAVPVEVLQRADRFLDDFPESVYAEQLHRGLLTYLRYVRFGRQGSVPREESECWERLYKKLAKEPPPAPMPAPRTPPEP